MHTSSFLLSLGLLAGLQCVAGAPTPAKGMGNNQLARVLSGTGLRGMTAAQLNTLISNLSAEGLQLGCGAGAGAGAGKGAAAGGGKDAAAGEGKDAAAGEGKDAAAGEGEAAAGEGKDAAAGEGEAAAGEGEAVAGEGEAAAGEEGEGSKFLLD